MNEQAPSLSNVANLIHDLNKMYETGNVVGMMSVTVLRKDAQLYVSMCNIAIEGSPAQAMIDGLGGLAEMVQEAIENSERGTHLQ